VPSTPAPSPDPVTGARATPIHQTTSFVFDNAEHASSLFNLQTFGNVYSRISNPTVAVFEERIASAGKRPRRAGLRQRHGGTNGGAAGHFENGRPHCGGEHACMAAPWGNWAWASARLGIETTFVDPAHPDNFERAMRPNTRAVYGETIGNPLVNVLDIAAIAAVAHAHGVPLVIDNTVASPYLCNPL
jgi:O-acetylhomoserine (thiol)-lyase